MSLRGSKWTAWAGRPGSRPPSSTVVSSSPATTCAFVTTRPGAATQPEPATPSPHALPRTFTTLAAASWTSGSRAIRPRGGATPASGPSIRGNGSSRRSEFSSGPDGGRTVLSRWRIAERWTSVRIR